MVDEKIAKYVDAVKPHIESFKTGIEEARDGVIRIRVEDLAKAIGMTEKHLTSIYWDLKYTLFQEGIVVTTGRTRADEPILAMRKKMKGDTLQRIDISKFKDIILSSKDDFWEFVSKLPDDLKCSELIELFSFGKFVEKIYFDSSSCEPYSAKESMLYIKLNTSAKISDVIKIFARIKPQELDYDESTHTITFWFD